MTLTPFCRYVIKEIPYSISESPLIQIETCIDYSFINSLLFPKENIQRYAFKVEFLTELVLYKAAVRILDILGEVGKKDKLRQVGR